MSSLLINLISLPNCPFTDEFSSILLVKYGRTSFTGPYGTYLKYDNKNYKIKQGIKYTEEYCLSIIKH